MNLSAWLQYLETLPSGLKNNSLANVKAVAKKLNLLNFTGKIITVGGTNGKGSCVIFLEAILLAAGYKTAAYLSPHLLHYNERIRINGKNTDDKTLCQAFATINRIRKNTDLSYFEFGTLAALNIFKKQKVDILILEVGLGGRFDAVNILDPDISIITTVSLDHTKILGNTREAIGYEKAGIMRAFKPTICGDQKIPKSIVLAAQKIKAELFQLNRDFFYKQKNWQWDWQCGKKTIKNLPMPKLPLANAATALMAINLLQKDFKINLKNIMLGLKKAFLPGRWQHKFIDTKEIIFDVAHNPESVALLAQNLIATRPKGRVLAVLSMLKDKDITASLRPLITIIDKWYIGELEDDVRAASAKLLVHSLLKVGVANFVVLPNVFAALQQVIAECQIKDKIVVFGSFHTVAKAIQYDLL